MMPSGSTNWSSICVGLSFAVFATWMARKGRWRLFAGAAAGDYQLANTRGTATSTSSTSTTSGSNPGSPTALLQPAIPAGAPGSVAAPGPRLAPLPSSGGSVPSLLIPGS